MAAAAAPGIRVVDADTHLTEPVDLRTMMTKVLHDNVARVYHLDP
jgi:hypothetical protein